MFKFLALAAIIGMAAAIPIDSDVAAETKVLANEISPEGVFHYGFQTSNGIEVDSNGDLHAIAGNYKYVSPEGQPILLSYTADENGFHPVGEHLPTPPPVPEGIIRALEYISAHPPTPEPVHG